jgi:hypothetical protein
VEIRTSGSYLCGIWCQGATKWKILCKMEAHNLRFRESIARYFAKKIKMSFLMSYLLIIKYGGDN